MNYSTVLVFFAVLVLLLVIAVSWLVWRLFYFWKAGVTARVGSKYPYVALAAAMASGSDPELRDHFRKWLQHTVDVHGWQTADAELEKFISSAGAPPHTLKF